jgi:PAS domain S-box-containing protein
MATFAARWAVALHGDGAPAAAVAATERVLARLVERLAAALTADPFRPGAGHEVGAELVGVVAAGEPLGATVTCLAGLPDALGIDPRVAGERMPLLLGEVVTGYTAALRACTLEELEAHGDGTSPAARALAAERALRAEQARYRAVLAGVEVPVAVCEPAGRFLDANAGFVDLLRHRVAYLRAHTLFELAHEEDGAMLARVVDRDLVHGPHRRVRTEVRLRRRSGSLVVVPLALSVTRDAAGAAAYLVAAAAQRRANGELVTTATPPDGVTMPWLAGTNAARRTAGGTAP